MELNIPDSWSKVTLKQLADIDAARSYEGNEIHKWNRILSVLSNQPLNVIEGLPFAYVTGLMGKCDWITQMPTKLISTFTIDGKEFQLTTNIFNASTGQYADLSELIQKDGYYKLAECMAVMCLPKGQTYDSATLNERAQLFWEHATIDIVFPMSAFFLTLFESSLKVTRDSLNKKLREIAKEVKTTLTETVEAS